jgi:hypothetical protein
MYLLDTNILGELIRLRPDPLVPYPGDAQRAALRSRSGFDGGELVRAPAALGTTHRLTNPQAYSVLFLMAEKG